MVVQFLTLGGLGTEQGTAAELQVFTALVDGLVDQEVLLLRAYLRDHMTCLGVAEQTQNTDALTVQQLHGAQQRRLLVQRVTAVGAENGGDIEGLVLDKGVRGGIPCGVAASLEGGAQTAGREGGSVRFAAGQLLAGQFHQNLTIAGGHDKAVVLFGGKTGHGLEPVGVVGCALFDGPVLHDSSDFRCQRTVQRGALHQTLLQSGIGIRTQTLSHLLVIKYHASKQLGDVICLIHTGLLSPKWRFMK